jgi:hypothetical protein
MERDLVEALTCTLMRRATTEAVHQSWCAGDQGDGFKEKGLGAAVKATNLNESTWI